MKKIVGVAFHDVKTNNIYYLLKPNRRSDLIEKCFMDDQKDYKNFVHGFIDEENNFLDRKQAFKRAIDTKQIDEIYKEDGVLISEDLW